MDKQKYSETTKAETNIAVYHIKQRALETMESPFTVINKCIFDIFDIFASYCTKYFHSNIMYNNVSHFYLFFFFIEDEAYVVNILLFFLPTTF